MKWCIAGLLATLALCACGPKNEPAAESVDLKNGKVVVIFEDCPLQTSTRVFGGSRSHVENRTINFMDENGDRVVFDPRLVGRDTLEIPTYLGYAEMQHLYQAFEYNCYLLQEGDTVLVRYGETGRPTLQSLVYEGNSDVYNLPYSIPDAIQKFGYYIETVLTRTNFTNAYRYFHDKAHRAKYPGLEDSYRPVYVDLDSLAIVHKQYLTTLSTAVDSLYRGQIIDTSYYRYMQHRFFPENRYTPEEVIQSDSLLHYVSNFSTAQHYQNAHLYSNIVASFDRIARDTVMTPLAKRGTLKRLLNLILTDESGWKHYSKDLKSRYTQKYIELTGDSTVVTKVATKEIAVASLNSALPLESTDGEAISLEKLLESHKGKVVYVDFWASWCGPCIGQFPKSRELHKRFAGKDVVFLFISTDSNQKSWMDKVNENTDLLSGSYRVLDPDADFLKQIKLEKIPRFLIYGRDGKLVNPDAPRPTDESINEALNALL